ncbi:MAG: hypothetical protein ACRC80_31270 [Waterburya sp.]
MANQIHDTVSTLFADTAFISVRVDGIDYYPVSALPKDPTGECGFPVRQNEATTDLKRLLGKGFQSAKIATSLNPKKVDCLSHETLSQVVMLIARKGNSEFCWRLLEASFNTELKRANDFARGEQEKEEYYQQWLNERSVGIKRRREFTDYIQDCEEKGIDVNYGLMTLNIYRYLGLNDKYDAWYTLFETRSRRAKNPFRCTLNQHELYELSCLEHLVAKVGNKHQFTPQDSISWIESNL